MNFGVGGTLINEGGGSYTLLTNNAPMCFNSKVDLPPGKAIVVFGPQGQVVFFESLAKKENFLSALFSRLARDTIHYCRQERIKQEYSRTLKNPTPSGELGILGWLVLFSLGVCSLWIVIKDLFLS